MKEDKEDLIEDVFDTHGYKQGQEVLIDAEFLIGILSFCRRVDEQQPKLAVPAKYAKEVRVVSDKESGEVVRVDTEWSEYPTKTAFTNTAFDIKSAVPILTQLGLFSFQIQNALYNFHVNNINNGVAIKFEQDGGGN